MTFWITALLIAAAIAAILVGALRAARRNVLSGAESDMTVYRDQLTEIDRDLARGVLTEVEAEGIRTEVSRRLLNADRRATEEDTPASEHMVPAAVLVVVVLLAGGGWLYSIMGAPGYPDLPMAGRIADLDAASSSRMSQADAERLAAPNMPAMPEPEQKFVELMDQLRASVDERPDDLRGLMLLAENEARLGNFTAAREAQDKVLALKGADAEPIDLLMGIDVMVLGAGGYVSPQAEVLVNRLMKLQPHSGAAQYYAGLTYAQTGRADLAFPIWQSLLEDSPPDAPWIPIIRADIEAVANAAGVRYAAPEPRGPSADDMAAAADMTDDERQEMIRGMVNGLSDRLATEGGPVTDWARLISALGVLGETDRAQAIVTEARQVFSDDEDAMRMINDAAAKAGLSE